MHIERELSWERLVCNENIQDDHKFPCRQMIFDYNCIDSSMSKDFLFRILFYLVGLMHPKNLRWLCLATKTFSLHVPSYRQTWCAAVSTRPTTCSTAPSSPTSPGVNWWTSSTWTLGTGSGSITVDCESYWTSSWYSPLRLDNSLPPPPLRYLLSQT